MKMCWTEAGSCYVYVFPALFCHVMHNDEETDAKSSDDISWMKTAGLGSFITSSLYHHGRGHCKCQFGDEEQGKWPETQETDSQQ